MKKKILVIIGITLLIVSSMCIGRSIMANKNLEKRDKEITEKVNEAIDKLSSEAKEELNYDELIQDIKSRSRGHGLIYATGKVDTSGMDKIEIILVEANHRRIGKGYYYEENNGGECMGYIFRSSVDDRVLYVETTYVPFSRSFRRRFCKKSKNIYF